MKRASWLPATPRGWRLVTSSHAIHWRRYKRLARKSMLHTIRDRLPDGLS